jgi:RNA-directed DNA polymerase
VTRNYSIQWHNINWTKVNKYVSSNQAKIVEAYKEGNLTKLHSIQYKSMMSFEFRAYATRKVTTNEGRNTPGVDKILWNNPRLKFKAISILRLVMTHPKKYKPNLIKRVWIPKPDSDKLRPLGIPTMIDKATQTLISLVLDPVAEELSDKYSYGLRKNKSAHDAVARVRYLSDKWYSPIWVLDLDIKNCFDTLSHDFIIQTIKPILPKISKSFIEKWLKAGIIEKNVITYPKAGTPQGSVISPILCNLCLNGIDEIIRPGMPLVCLKIRTRKNIKL